jgi:hypothetical protein
LQAISGSGGENGCGSVSFGLRPSSLSSPSNLGHLSLLGTGPNGRPASPVPIQLQGRRIDGLLEDGDIVEFYGKAQPATVMSPQIIRNLTKKSEIVVHPVRVGWGLVGWAGCLIPVIVFVTFVLIVSGALKALK